MCTWDTTKQIGNGVVYQTTKEDPTYIISNEVPEDISKHQLLLTRLVVLTFEAMEINEISS